MSKIVRCNGCGVDIQDRDWPSVVGTPVSRGGLSGGALSLKPGEEFDWCPLCTVAAFTGLGLVQQLIAAMRIQGLTRNEHQLALRDYLLDPLTRDEANALADLDDRGQDNRLAARYGQPGWRVAKSALMLHMHPPAQE